MTFFPTMGVISKIVARQGKTVVNVDAPVLNYGFRIPGYKILPLIRTVD